MKILAAVFSLCFISPVWSLAVVESRTGDPVVRNAEHAVPRVVQEGSSRVDESLRIHETTNVETSTPAAYPSHRAQSEEQRALRLTLTQMEALQREISELRGLVEMQDHEIKQLKKSQQSLYADLERRINDASAVTSPTAASPVRGAASPSQASSPAIEKMGTEIKTVEDSTLLKGVDSKVSESKASASDTKAADPKGSKDPKGAKSPKASPMGTQSKAPSLITPETSKDIGVISNQSATPQSATPQSATSKSTAETSKTAAHKTAAPIMTIKSEGANQTAPRETTKETSHSDTSQVFQPHAKVEETVAPKVTLANLNENDTYQTAYGYVRSKHYGEAIEALQQYIKRFPEGTQAANAHYWLAEVYMVQWQGDKTKSDLIEKASQEFKNVSTQFPNHTKAGDAILKLGLIEIDKGDMTTARQYLTEVKTRYPSTAAARIADARLQQLR